MEHEVRQLKEAGGQVTNNFVVLEYIDRRWEVIKERQSCALSF